MLENYSFYTTILAAFVRKAGSMSFKVSGADRQTVGCILPRDALVAGAERWVIRLTSESLYILENSAKEGFGV